MQVQTISSYFHVRHSWVYYCFD